MKRIALLCSLLWALGLGLTADEYVDLGLPSKTKWCSENEDVPPLTFYEVHSLFGTAVPTKEQFQELFKYCTATPEGNGVRLKGPNGKSIYLPYDKYHCFSSFLGKTGIYIEDDGYYNNKNQYIVSWSEKRIELSALLSFRSVYTAEPKLREIENADIDLALPSGVKWKAMNDPYFNSYEDMCTGFNVNTIPTQKEWEELRDKCTWEWIRYGYRIKNKNGKGGCLFLPVEGYVDMSESQDIKGNRYSTAYWVNPYGDNRPKAFSLNAPSADKKKLVYYFDNKKLYFPVRCVTSYEPHPLCRMAPKVVDMGLPSKTKWLSITEPGEMDWYTATKKYGTGVPSQAEFEELLKYCTVKYFRPLQEFFPTNLVNDLLRTDVLVTAHNGNQIFLRGGWFWTRTDYNINNVTGAYYLRVLDDKTIWGKSGRKDKMYIHQVRHK